MFTKSLGAHRYRESLEFTVSVTGHEDVAVTHAAWTMLHRRARQAEEKCLCEMQRETPITSDVLSVLSFDPLIVCLRSIPALAFMSTHTTSRYIVTVKCFWPSLTHF